MSKRNLLEMNTVNNLKVFVFILYNFSIHDITIMFIR